MKTTSEMDLYFYDFALSDDLNEKLRKAVVLLDEVRFKLASEEAEYMENFLNELNQGTTQIRDTIRGLDQDAIV